MRGERTPSEGAAALQSGSSPPGNVASMYTRWPSGTDHPRMGGERFVRKAGDIRKDGSSPHARGTHLGVSGRQFRRRIIPACAGNAPLAHRGAVGLPDHPRMRGERRGTGDETPGGGGSSPHARGTRG